MSTPTPKLRLLKIIVCTADGKDIIATRYTDELEDDVLFHLDNSIATFDSIEEYRTYGGTAE